VVPSIAALLLLRRGGNFLIYADCSLKETKGAMGEKQMSVNAHSLHRMGCWIPKRTMNDDGFFRRRCSSSPECRRSKTQQR
jgi:hypothetical protein